MDNKAHPRGEATDQKRTSGGTQSPEPPSVSETKTQRRQSWTESLRGEPLPLLSASQEDAPLGTSSTETRGKAIPPHLLPPTQQPTPLTLGRALYLLSMGKLTTVPEILHRAPIIDLFNHFIRKLVEDPDWAGTPAGVDYTHYRYSYILKEEARHFACVAWNMVHPECRVEVPDRYW
ncbi:hypothetical protein ARMGADRAFT_1090105 [Armillaria gallica]|uniref:Uncharacterized protein n=1 Tax=Armillaria gallica TaxID=47427 RepID=A0A2H3D5B4_ARMGA|nr:hypothetical protein ARMGADRAFT_1090105 [Armillaria gallica]